jgi:hypothetical protein
MPTRRALYFLHIPKTAGTAFTEFLDSQFDRSEILPHRTWNQVFQATSDEEIARSPGLLRGAALVRGHFGTSGLRELPRHTDLVTVLREPLDRVVSQYEHLRRDPLTNNWAPPEFLEDIRGLADVLSSPTASAFFSDTQTRYLAADVDVRRIWLNTPPSEQSRWLFDSSTAFIQAVSSPAARKRLLRLALGRIERITVVGVQDMLQETLLVSAYRLALSPSVAFQGLMSAPAESPRREEDSTSEALRGLNRADGVLYQAARARLVSDYVAMARRLLNRPRLSARDVLGARRLVNDEVHRVLVERE